MQPPIAIAMLERSQQMKNECEVLIVGRVGAPGALTAPGRDRE